MKKHEIRLLGPGAQGTRVAAEILRDVLSVVIEGSRRAVRMRTQGRSSARGPAPAWVDAIAAYTLEIKEGSTLLDLEVPSLLEAAPEEFGQRNLFPEIDPERSSFDYFSESLAAAARGDATSSFFDKGLLEVFRRLDKALSAGADQIVIKYGSGLRVGRGEVERIAALEASIPPCQYVRLAGRLDTIRHSDRTFTVIATAENQRIKGIAEQAHIPALQELWGKAVVVSGAAHFTAGGGVLRIEADRIQAAGDKDEDLWGRVPRPVEQAIPLSELRVPQGPRSGLNAIIGQWPGDESDEVVLGALEEIS